MSEERERKRVHEINAQDAKTRRQCQLKVLNLHLVGNGVFSNVYRGTLLRKEGKTEIAIKKTWPSTSREKNFEVKFLMCEDRKPHKNIMQMMYIFCSGEYRSVGEDNIERMRVCESLVFEYMPNTLHEVIRNMEIPNLDIKLYTWQIFSGLHFLSCINVVHRDLKPVNILVNTETGLLKISDFGSSKVLTAAMTATAYQVTRYYRPPELLLGASHYDSCIDVWSGGCCFGEMLKRRTLFPGGDSRHQLRLIINILGLPTESDIKAMRVHVKFEEEEQKKHGKGFEKMLPHCPADAVDLLKQIMVFNPKARLQGLDLLRDHYFEEIFVPGTRRNNGQLVSACIDRTDLHVAEQCSAERAERLKDKKPEKSGDGRTGKQNVVKIHAGSPQEDAEKILRRPKGTVMARSKMSTNASVYKRVTPEQKSNEKTPEHQKSNEKMGVRQKLSKNSSVYALNQADRKKSHEKVRQKPSRSNEKIVVRQKTSRNRSVYATSTPEQRSNEKMHPRQKTSKNKSVYAMNPQEPKSNEKMRTKASTYSNYNRKK